MAANGSQAADTPDSADNSSKAPAATEEDNFVIIDCDDGEKLELPVNDEDSTLNLATLVSAFPGAVGLKFKNPTTGASRALQMDSTGGKFMAPPGGWSNKSFSVIYGASQRDASGTTKRRKLDDDASESTCEKEARYSEPVGTDPPATCDLIVLGLPYKTSDEEMKKYFEQFGEVVCTEIKRLPSGQSKGFGFVRMADYAIQKRLLDQDYHQIDGRQCQVKLPPRKGGGPSTTSQGSHQTSQVFGLKLFVGRLPTTATTDSVRQFFIEEARKIDSKAAVTDVFLPRPFRAFGFVSLSSMSACVELVKRGSAIMEGTSISITSAAPREQMQAMQSRNHEPSGPTYGYGRGSQFQWGASPPPHQYPAHHHHPPSAYGYTHAPVPTAYGYYETNAPSAYGAGTAATDYSSYYQQQHHDRRNGAAAAAPSAIRGVVPTQTAVQPQTTAYRVDGVVPSASTHAAPWRDAQGRPTASLAHAPPGPVPPPPHNGPAGIASGLNALDINQQKEVLSEAWRAFMSSINTTITTKNPVSSRPP